MAKTQSVVEINGSRYDIFSGHIVDGGKSQVHHPKKQSTGVIDGFTRRSTLPTIITPSITQSPTKPKVSKAHPTTKRKHHPAKAIHKRAQRSRTLMRSAVTKPTKQPIEEKHQLKPTKAPLNPGRALRAKSVAKHEGINRFGANSDEVATAAPRPHQAVSAAAYAHQATSTASSRLLPSISDMSSSQLEQLLDQALLKANSHRQAYEGRRRGFFRQLRTMAKWQNLGAASLAVIVLVGFFAWQNIPYISMKLAATRANIAASIPGYTPSGFRFAGPISYSNGAVSISFKANSDDFRHFKIVQQKSNWDSQTLAANTLPADSQVQTSQVKGTTVYIYGDKNDATWVDKGVRYTLADNANLTTDQILKIVDSM